MKTNNLLINKYKHVVTSGRSSNNEQIELRTIDGFQSLLIAKSRGKITKIEELDLCMDAGRRVFERWMTPWIFEALGRF